MAFVLPHLPHSFVGMIFNSEVDGGDIRMLDIADDHAKEVTMCHEPHLRAFGN